MPYKSINDIPELQKPSRYFFDRARQKEIEQVLENVNPLRLDYEPYRQQLANELAFRYKFQPNQINDTLDAYLTKASYYNNNKKNNYKKHSVGRFETGVDSIAAQDQAKQLLRQNGGAYASVYGLTPTDIQNPQNTGFKKPFIVSDYDELQDVEDSLKWSTKNPKFRLNVLYRQNLED